MSITYASASLCVQAFKDKFAPLLYAFVKTANVQGGTYSLEIFFSSVSFISVRPLATIMYLRFQGNKALW